MNRTAFTDGSGRWFNESSARYFPEDTYHNGRNFISKATGSQWAHEAIYITKGGVFVLRSWSDYQGSNDSFLEISKSFAAEWFAKQSFPDDKIPPEFLDEVNSLEV